MNDIRAVVSVDIAKHVFQVHEVSKETGEITSLQLKRKSFLAHFANRATCLIGMEACGGAQHWARKLVALGHVVRLLPALQVKAFVCGKGAGFRWPSILDGRTDHVSIFRATVNPSKDMQTGMESILA